MNDFDSKKIRSFKPPKLWALKAVRISSDPTPPLESEEPKPVWKEIRRVNETVSFSEITRAHTPSFSPEKEDDIDPGGTVTLVLVNFLAILIKAEVMVYRSHII